MTATVLVVEDEKKIRDLLRGMLERAGLVVVSTGSGAEAIDLAGGHSPTWSCWTWGYRTCRAKRSPGRSAGSARRRS